MDFVDANVFWHWLNGAKCKSFFEEIASGTRPACTSYHVLVEMHMALLDAGYDATDAEKSIEAVLNIPNLEFVELDRDIFLKALFFFSEFDDMAIFDSLHAALCIERGFRLATFDKHFSRVKGLKTLKPSLD